MQITSPPNERPLWYLWLFYSGVDFTLGWGLGGAAFALAGTDVPAAPVSPNTSTISPFELRLLGAVLLVIAAGLTRWVMLVRRRPEQDGLLAGQTFLLLSAAAVTATTIAAALITPGVNPNDLAPYSGRLLFQALAGAVFGAATWFALRWALPSPTPQLDFEFEDESR